MDPCPGGRKGCGSDDCPDCSPPEIERCVECLNGCMCNTCPPPKYGEYGYDDHLLDVINSETEIATPWNPADLSHVHCLGCNDCNPFPGSEGIVSPPTVVTVANSELVQADLLEEADLRHRFCSYKATCMALPVHRQSGFYDSSIDYDDVCLAKDKPQCNGDCEGFCPNICCKCTKESESCFNCMSPPWDELYYYPRL